MRPSTRIVTPVVIATVLLTGPPATAYMDVGYDPDDRTETGSPPIGGDPDIRSTLRLVERRTNGRVLVVVIRAYEDFTLYWEIDVHLDSRGDGRTDHVLRLSNNDTGPAHCLIRRGDHDRLLYFRQHGKAARCRVPIRFVGPTKTIRWRLVSASRYEDGEVEVAPNGGGWYK